MMNRMLGLSAEGAAGANPVVNTRVNAHDSEHISDFMAGFRVGGRVPDGARVVSDNA